MWHEPWDMASAWVVEPLHAGLFWAHGRIYTMVTMGPTSLSLRSDRRLCFLLVRSSDRCLCPLQWPGGRRSTHRSPDRIHAASLQREPALWSRMKVPIFKDALHFLLPSTWDTLFRKHLHILMAEISWPTQAAGIQGAGLTKVQSVTTPVQIRLFSSFFSCSVPRHLSLQSLEADGRWAAGFNSRLFLP